MLKEFRIKKPLFGKEIEITIKNTERILIEHIIEDVYRYGLKLQQVFNFFDKKSELTKLNKNRELIVSKHFLEVIKKALKLCELTKGEYDITVGKQILQRKKGLKIKPTNSSYKNIKIKGNKIFLTHKDVLIDLGSIAKGYITDKITEYLIVQGVNSGVIDSRGDIKVFGKSESIDIQHPRYKNKVVETLKLKNLSIATSGDYNQYHKNFNKSHIINKKDLISVTVIAKTLEEADLYATAIMVLNKKNREELIKTNKKIRVLTIDSDLNIKRYNGLEKLT